MLSGCSGAYFLQRCFTVDRCRFRLSQQFCARITSVSGVICAVRPSGCIDCLVGAFVEMFVMGCYYLGLAAGLLPADEQTQLSQ